VIWLLIFSAAVLFFFLCLLLEELLFERRPQPRITTPVRVMTPLPPPRRLPTRTPRRFPTRICVDMTRARAARAVRAARGRPEEPQ
jgi:hypothetical protein